MIARDRVCLIVIDGWGVSPINGLKGDAIANAKTPVMDSLIEKYPNVQLAAHGLQVGLPDGLMGNSEVGHLNIGAGRVVYQDIVRIDAAMEKEVLDIPVFNEMVEKACNGSSRLHLIGLVSDGGVHSHQRHLYRMIRQARESKVKNIYVHAITDGRDTAPKSSVGYLQQLEAELGVGAKLATVMGRYYAMDRDKRWERTTIAVEALLNGAVNVTQEMDLFKTIESKYANGETDEFFKPMILDAVGRIQPDDVVVFFNYRSDRMRQIVAVLGGLNESVFSVPKVQLACMTRYQAEYPFPVLFPPQSLDMVLAKVISKSGLKQKHIGETEKYAHVTFFFNGGREEPFDREERLMIPSPKVSTYDLQPAMSVHQVAQAVVDAVRDSSMAFVMCNFAPPDMVGHTGKMQACIEAVQATDEAIGLVYEACKKEGVVLVVTSDHGNAEIMMGVDGVSEHTAHTCQPVPLIVAKKDIALKSHANLALCDVAPTILGLMGLSCPAEMTGYSLI